MRLIDADALKIEIACVYGSNPRYLNWLNHAPTVDAVPVRHGKWLYDNQFHWYRASCNQCGYYRVTDIKADGWNEWRFCPMCGARMDEVEE